MKKAFMGLRLKRLREEQRLTQAALAQRLGISLSYLNQLENNQRPLTVQVLLALNTAFGLDLQVFSEDDEARLITDLREALSDAAFGETIAAVELRELAMNMPSVGRALVTIHRKYRQSIEQASSTKPPKPSRRRWTFRSDGWTPRSRPIWLTVTVSNWLLRRSTICRRAMNENSMREPIRFISHLACGRDSAPFSWEHKSPCWRSTAN